ncbi:hypothetical protein BC829DRAFT_420319 [Chytridium lagenaria]|nr:hypothetical protein BC829DRAFT_420319 [Chytridium lagenaria]
MLSINTCLDTSYPFTRNVVYISYEELTRPVKKSSIGTGNMMRNVAVERSKGNNSSMATADKSAHEPVYGKKSLPPLPKTTLSISANRQFALSKPNKSTATTTPASTIRMIVASQPKTPKQYYSTALKNKTYDATSITRSSRFGPANLMSPAQLKNGNVAPTLSPLASRQSHDQEFNGANYYQTTIFIFDHSA